MARRLVDAPPPSVGYERVGAAAVLTIDRPERRNAVDGPTAAALRDGFDRFCADDGARVLVLTGAGPDAFCAGADLKALDTLGPRLADPGGPLGFTRLASPKPTVAAIGGWCVAGGLELALWCDLRNAEAPLRAAQARRRVGDPRIADATARLGCTERRFGVPLVDGGTQRLPRIVAQGRALDLILTGRVVDAAEALAIGLVTEVVAAGAHRDRALAVAEGLAAFPQETMLADRAAALASFGHPLEAGLALEARSGERTFATARDGAARFAGGAGRGATGSGV